MIRRPPRSTLSSSSAASDVYKRQVSTQSTWENQILKKQIQKQKNKISQKTVMNKELFYNAFSEGIASMLSELSSYPISRFNDSLQGKKRDKWSPYNFVDLKTEIKSLFLSAFPYGITFNVAFAYTYSAFLNKLKLPNKIALGMGAAVSECIAELTKIPISNLAEIMQNDQSTSFFNAFSKKKNFKGLFQGYLPTVIVTIPFYFTVAPVFEHIKGKVMKNKKKVKMNDCLWISAVSIGIGNMIANPVAVMTQNLQETKQQLCYGNYATEFCRILKSGNAISQFYKNLCSRNIGGLAGVVYMTSCDTISSLFQKEQENF
eukprot:TRINITY_DN4020_c0_g1_i6.p3 TRINITY_DN4020_c0_g1~~TRINITY_DN4020_c0_g1_i6.p3  ORF type:complete len:318 (+),score=59.07 TRINITY_DN4020_c0_g1_i6:82-1035(+)